MMTRTRGGGTPHKGTDMKSRKRERKDTYQLKEFASWGMKKKKKAFRR